MDSFDLLSLQKAFQIQNIFGQQEILYSGYSKAQETLRGFRTDEEKHIVL